MAESGGQYHVLDVHRVQVPAPGSLPDCVASQRSTRSTDVRHVGGT